MTDGSTRLRSELDVLVPLVRQAAGEELLSRFRQVESRRKADGSLITEADLAMQQRLLDELQRRWPERRLLGEEMPASEQRRLLREGDAGVWCLDPLDGTRNFASGFPVFSVSLALVIGGEVVLGLVLDPVRDECFTAAKGEGAWLDGEPLTLAGEDGELAGTLAIADLKRLPAPVACRLATEPPFASQRSIGSVALDWCWLAAGRVQLYVHGRQNLWDYAAGRLVFDEAGGHHGTLEGQAAGPADLVPRSAVGAVGAERYRQWQAWLQEAVTP